ncbi:hypothetical protein BGZ80_009323 [Entomortierella chlamydospora]|uniref:t-SNARE coiled-coil homology domain-containing protein n=1 Tax=Entomortierella chlamydospora TaxID=101097 RepID=A0A9P6MXS7_9FUNG|nr:hypothetical protein BGZ79_008934 [Entomortierella chlamydospora]KAG0016276.1 hypothetical protein BGZ80_009323 [Entomortierella chlamydospora]
MSFADLERGLGGIKRDNGPSPAPFGRSVGSNANGNWGQRGTDSLGDVSQYAYQAKIKHISQQIFRISSNVSTIQRLVGYLGTLKDSQEVRTKLYAAIAQHQDVTEQSRTLVRETSQDIKDLTKFDAAGKKLEHQKVSKDFSKVLVDFQKIQRVSAEKQRDFVLKARQVGTRNDHYDEESGETGEQPLINDDQRRLQLLVVDNELEYNESMITQREEEIREIEQGINELNEIFRDLGSMVHEQGNMLDSIESNVSAIAVTTHAAAEELTTAAVHQKKARNKSCYLLLIVSAVAAIVILAAL